MYTHTDYFYRNLKKFFRRSKKIDKRRVKNDCDTYLGVGHPLMKVFDTWSVNNYKNVQTKEQNFKHTVLSYVISWLRARLFCFDHVAYPHLRKD